MPGSRRTRRGQGEAERKAELINALRALASTNGPEMTLRQFYRRQGIPTSHVYRDFDSWAELRVAAGLPATIDRRAAAAVHTRQSLLQALADIVEETGPNVSVTEFWRRTGISIQPIVRVFGSWREMRIAGGLSPAAHREPECRHSRTGLLWWLYVLAKGTPHITLIEFCAAIDVSPILVYRLGPWTSLRRELGLPTKGSRRKAASYEMYKDILWPIVPKRPPGFAEPTNPPGESEQETEEAEPTSDSRLLIPLTSDI